MKAVKVALYARYSSDNQRDASIADQLRIQPQAPELLAEVLRVAALAGDRGIEIVAPHRIHRRDRDERAQGRNDVSGQ